MDGRDDLSDPVSPAIDYTVVRARVLEEALAPGSVLLVGDSSAAKELMAAGPDRFVPDRAAPESGITGVLALSLDREVLDRARAVATERGCTAMWALVEPVAGETEPVAAVRSALRSSGLVLVGLRRIFWPVTREPDPRSRARRIEDETRELLVRLVAADSEQQSLLLEEELARVERELSVASELRMEQQIARARMEHRLGECLLKHQELEADRERLEAEVTRLGGQVTQLNQQLQDARQAIEASRHRSSRWLVVRRMHRT